jgi:hypothetical protein
MRLSLVVLLSILMASTQAFFEDNINGVWKHSQKPAWFDVNFESGVGSVFVKRHDNNLKAAGLNIIKEIKPDVNQSLQWNGKMYSAAENGYVSVMLILINPSTIAIFERSDINKDNEILRLTRE